MVRTLVHELDSELVWCFRASLLAVVEKPTRPKIALPGPQFVRVIHSQRTPTHTLAVVLFGFDAKPIIHAEKTRF